MTEKNAEAWIEIARPGRFQDSGGAWHEFTAGRLGDLATKYDPAGREAPLVLGHPATDGPAHGWVKGLKFDGRKLLARVIWQFFQTYVTAYIERGPLALASSGGGDGTSGVPRGGSPWWGEAWGRARGAALKNEFFIFIPPIQAQNIHPVKQSEPFDRPQPLPTT